MKLIYNAGGYGREIRHAARLVMPDEEFLLVDDTPEGEAISFEEACRLREAEGAEITVAFGDPALRRRKTEQVLEAGFDLFSIVAPNAVISDNVTLGPGALLIHFTLLTTDVTIGKGFHCGGFSFVGHDSVVGDFVTLAPKVAVNGRCLIEDDVYIGTGASVLPGQDGKPTRIGKGAVVGAHALVTKDVAPGTTVVGVPARPMVK
ncbi:MAG: acetyltransferase [Pseudomonadota bacterium]